ncbi:hypothetical protein BDR03DRAFT_986000 [Suillus americanus]|nr:hypothetical protein BDR03DRAFT_986000 [Suillus americanus]
MCQKIGHQIWEREKGNSMIKRMQLYLLYHKLYEPAGSSIWSIFEYISKDQECIQNIAASRFGPLSTSDDPSPGSSLRLPGSHTLTPMLPKLLSTAFSPSWPIPPSRQGAIPPAQKPGQTDEEFAKEISDYAKSAALFCLDLGTKIISGMHTPAAQPEEGADSMDVGEEKPKEEIKLRSLSSQHNVSRQIHEDKRGSDASGEWELWE